MQSTHPAKIRKLRLLIAITALFLALSETLGKGAQTESISKNVEASDLWAIFQAKNIRRTVVQSVSDHAKLSLGLKRDEKAKTALSKQIDDWQKTAARCRSDPETVRAQNNLPSARRNPRRNATLQWPDSINLSCLGYFSNWNRVGVGYHYFGHDSAGLGGGFAGGGGPGICSYRTVCAPCRTPNVNRYPAKT